MAKRRTDAIKKKLRRKPVVQKIDPKMFLSSGSTCLNLATTGDARGTFIPGHYYFFVGDSDSGKTFLCLTCFAEACINPKYNGYDLIYDAPEGGALMDIGRFFGEAVVERMRPPAYELDGTPKHSGTVQEFYFHVDDALKRGKPCIYVLDSQDSLSSDSEGKKFDQTKRATRKKSTDDEPKGSFGDGKAKVHSSFIRRVLKPLQASGSILIVINQTRDSFDMFQPSSYSGGRALKFYATLQLWSSSGGKIFKTVRGKKRQLGINAKVRVKKNRITGRDRSIVVPIHHSSGIDDVGGCIDYLISEKVWPAKDGKVKVKGIGPDQVMTREKAIQWIEYRNLEEDLRELVAVTWQEIEDACTVERKRRYE